MLAYRYTVLSYARDFVFVHPEEIPTGAVSDRAATVQMYRFIPPRSDFNAVAQRRAIVGRWIARHHRLLGDVLPTRKRRAELTSVLQQALDTGIFKRLEAWVALYARIVSKPTIGAE